MAAFADEVAAMATALIRRLHLARTDVEVILGGGTLQAVDQAVPGRIRTQVTAAAPRARVCVLEVAPVFGALVDAWSRTGAPAAGLRQAQEQLLVGRQGRPA